MSRKALGGILAAIGLILIVVGIVVMFVIVPGMKQWPDDVDTTRTYDGSIPTLLVLNAENPAESQFVPFENVTLTRHVVTEDTDGDYALVLEDITITAPGVDTPLVHNVKRYAVDRHSMEAVDSGYPDDWATTEGFWDIRRGLVLGWGMDVEKKDYLGWSDDYASTVDLVYQGEEEHGGINTYHFTSSGTPQEINPQVVQNALHLPTAMPKDILMTLLSASSMGSLAPMLQPAFDAYEDPEIPLQYYYEYTADYWVEPQTGVLIDTSKHELRKVGLGEAFLEGTPLANMGEEQREAMRIPVFDLTYATTEGSIKDAKNDADDAISKINLFGVILPAIAMIAGVLIIVIGGYFFVSRSKTAA
jgi:hypothetical protein